MKKVEWLWTMKKPQVPLAQGLHTRSVPIMQKILSLKEDLPIKHADGDIYFGKRGVEAIKEQLIKSIRQDFHYPEKLQRRIEAPIKKLKDTVNLLKEKNPGKQSDEELIASFFKGYRAIAEVTAFMSFKCTVQMSEILEKEVQLLLRQRIQEKKDQGIPAADDLFLLCSIPKRDSFMLQKQKSMLAIGAAKQSGRETEGLIKKHAKDFGWVGIVMYAGRPYTEEYVMKELSEAAKTNCYSRLEALKKQKVEREQQITKYIAALAFSAKEKDLINKFREWVHLRTYVKDMTSIGMEATVPWLDEIAKRIGVSYVDLLYLSHEELKEIFSDGKTNLIRESNMRQKGWGYTLIDGREAYFNYQNIGKIKDREIRGSGGIRGSPTYKGIVRGKAIIVTSVEDLDRIENGDILVTHMTTTNFVPYLSKVGAIVTDEGGITCHASIVSREMRIPCIVGTKNATRALRNGQIVEVRADIGVVKVLK